MNLFPSSSSADRSAGRGGLIRFVLAFLATLLLVVFLVVSRWSFSRVENLQIRAVNSMDRTVSTSAPPPPPPPASSAQPPPPPAELPVETELPRLDLSVNDTAPPVQALIESRSLNLGMKVADFSPAVQTGKPANLFASFQLDDQPRLLNRPSVTYPPELKNEGIKEGRVVLEVLISRAGEVTIRDVVSSSHPDFIPMAKSFAARARFSPPKKDGRVVNALFNWPLVLRP